METPLRARVLQIINSSGLSRREVAERAGIDESKLSKSLSGKRRFSSLELAVIAGIGERTVEWLLTGVPPKNFRFAARNSATTLDIEEDRVSDLLEDLSDRFGALRDLGLAPALPPLPTISSSGRYLSDASTAAQTALARLQSMRLSECSVLDLATRIENSLGINVVIEPLPDGLDGVSYQDGDFRVIALAPTDMSFRQRFTLGHELGHILFRDAEERLVAEVMWESTKQDDDHRESRANAFSAAFLIPESELRTILSGRDPVEIFPELTWRFRVAPKTMAWRLFNLGLIPEEDCNRFLTKSTREISLGLGELSEFAKRVEMSLQTRQPWLLIQAYLDAYSRGEVTLRPVASLLGWSLERTEAKFGDSTSGDDAAGLGN